MPDENVGLITIYNHGGKPSLDMFRSVFERRARRSIPRIEQIIAPNVLKQGTSLRNVSDDLLEALTDAYREAAGI